MEVPVLKLATLTAALALKITKEQTVIDLSLQHRPHRQQRREQQPKVGQPKRIERVPLVQRVLRNHHLQIFLFKISLVKVVS